MTCADPPCATQCAPRRPHRHWQSSGSAHPPQSARHRFSSSRWPTGAAAECAALQTRPGTSANPPQSTGWRCHRPASSQTSRVRPAVPEWRRARRVPVVWHCPAPNLRSPHSPDTAAPRSTGRASWPAGSGPDLAARAGAVFHAPRCPAAGAGRSVRAPPDSTGSRAVRPVPWIRPWTPAWIRPWIRSSTASRKPARFGAGTDRPRASSARRRSQSSGSGRSPRSRCQTVADRCVR